jgi:putative ABC transport system permease protein
MILRIAQEAVRNLIAAKQRSLLALLGIVIGTGSVIAMLNIGNIAESEALRQFSELGTNLLVIQDGAEGMSHPLDLTTLDQLAAGVPALLTLAPYGQKAGTLAFGSGTTMTQVMGVTETFRSAVRLVVSEGRFISAVDGHEPFVVLGSQLRQQLSQGGKLPGVGDLISLNDRPLTVIGLLAPKSANSLVRMAYDSCAFVPLDTLRRLERVGISTVVSVTDPSTPPMTTGDKVKVWFQGQERPRRVTIETAEELIAQLQAQSRMFTLMLGAIGSIALVVGGVGVMNIMLVTVSERRREIGIRMAVGAQPSHIRLQFLVEAVVLALIGGAIGTAAGIAASYGFARYSDYSFAVSGIAIAIGPAVSALVGVFSGYYPAEQAARLDPIEALRVE